MSHYFTGYLYVIFSAIGFGIASILIKWAYQLNVSPYQLLTTQNLIASLILWTFILGFRPKLGQISKKQLIQLFIQGIFGNLASSLLFFLSLQYLSASIAIVLLFTYPALVNLLAFICYHEKISFYRLISLFFTFLGVILTINLFRSPWESISLLGVVYGLASALATAFLNLYGQRILTTTKPIAVTIYPMTFSTIALCMISPPFYIFTGDFGWQACLLAFTLATASTILPLFTLMKGISIIGASKASILSTSEIPFTIFLAVLLLGDKMNIWQLIGTFLIIISIFLLHEEEKTTHY